MERNMIEASNGGTLVHKTLIGAWILLQPLLKISNNLVPELIHKER